MIKETVIKIRQHRSAQGYYRASVMEARDGKARQVSTTDWKKNLILDTGLDKIASMSWAQACQFCVAGTKVNPKPPRITDRQLEEPFAMNSFWLTGAPYCGNSQVGNTFKLWRTYDFYKVFTSLVITEIGFKESPAATSLFSRIVLNPAQKLHAGQFLRIEYQLHIELSPTTSSEPSPVPVISGDPAWITSTLDRESLQRVGLCGVDEDTAIAEPYDVSGFCNEVFAPGTRSFGPGYGYVNRWQNGPAVLGAGGYLNAANVAADPYTVFGPLYDYVSGNTPATQYRNPHEFWNFQFQKSNTFDPGVSDPAVFEVIAETFDSPYVGGAGNDAKRVAQINVLYSGSGYRAAPTLTITSSGSVHLNATATAVVTNGAVTSVNLILQGSYDINTVSFACTPTGGGKGALAGSMFTTTQYWSNYYSRSFMTDMGTHHGYSVTFQDSNNNGIHTMTADLQTPQTGISGANAANQLPDPLIKFLDNAGTNIGHAFNTYFFDPARGVPQPNAQVYFNGAYQTSFSDPSVYESKSGVPFVLGTNAAVLNSADGISWSIKNSTAINWLTDVAHGGGQFCAVGYVGSIYTSPDGVTWSRQNSLSINRLEGVAYAGDRFVAVGELGTVLTSTNGIRWEAKPSGVTRFLSSAAYNGTTTQVAIGHYGTIIQSLDDGETWAQWNGGAAAKLSVTVAGGIITGVTIVSGGAGYITVPTITVEDLLPNPNPGPVIAGSGAVLTAVLTDGVVTGVTITNGGTGYHQFSVTDGTVAIVADPQNVTTNVLFDVTWGSAKFVTVGDVGAIATSPDGKTWTLQTSGTTEPLLAVAYDGSGLYAAVGNNGTILSSADAITWVARTSGTTVDLTNVTFGGGLWCAVGGQINTEDGTSNNVILTSADAITWVSRSPVTPRLLEGIVYAESKFVIVGGIGTIAPVPEPTAGHYYWPDWRGANVAGSSCFLSNSNRDFSAFGAAPDLSTNVNASAAANVELPLRLEPYQLGTFRRTKFVLFDAAVGNGTWKWVGIGPTSNSILPAGMDGACKNAGYIYKFNTPNEKLEDHQLKLAFEYTWSRQE